MSTQTENHCWRCRTDCTPAANLSADAPGPDGAPASFVCVGWNRPQDRTVLADRFTLCWKNGTVDERGGRSIHRPIGTITTRDRHAVVDGKRMRMISVQEARAAMGFPASYVLPQHQRTAMHMLGNAVVPLVARDVINAIRSQA